MEPIFTYPIPLTLTLYPLALKDTKKESPMGGLGGNPAAEGEAAEKRAFLIFFFRACGFRALSPPRMN